MCPDFTLGQDDSIHPFSFYPWFGFHTKEVQIQKMCEKSLIHLNVLKGFKTDSIPKHDPLYLMGVPDIDLLLDHFFKRREIK